MGDKFSDHLRFKLVVGYCLSTLLVLQLCRDREVSHMSGSSRFGRKRPSMLSEFHGSKHYSHNAREGERDG